MKTAIALLVSAALSVSAFAQENDAVIPEALTKALSESALPDAGTFREEVKINLDKKGEVIGIKELPMKKLYFVEAENGSYVVSADGRFVFDGRLVDVWHRTTIRNLADAGKTNETCNNNGTCNDGTCDCTANFEGEKCENTVAKKFLGTYDINCNGTLNIDGTNETFVNEPGTAKIFQGEKPDEIIVVDSYSTDNTINLIKEHKNVQLICRKFINYTDQKRYALEQANYDWVLFLDADERITPTLKNEILDVINNPNKAVAFYFQRTFMFKSKKLHFSGWQSDKNYRLFIFLASFFWATKNGQFDDDYTKVLPILVHGDAAFAGNVGTLYIHHRAPTSRKNSPPSLSANNKCGCHRLTKFFS